MAIHLTMSISLLPLLHFTLLRKAFEDISTNFFFGCLIAFSVYWSGSQWMRILCATLLRFFGKISYRANLVHLALAYRLGLLPVEVRLAVVVLVPTASWYLFERPILRVKDCVTRVDTVTSKLTVGA
jgi:hypothetical protein